MLIETTSEALRRQRVADPRRRTSDRCDLGFVEHIPGVRPAVSFQAERSCFPNPPGSLNDHLARVLSDLRAHNCSVASLTTRRGDADALSALSFERHDYTKGRAALGYRRFNCRACARRFNERTDTPFNDLQYPTDIVLLAVLWRLRYKLSFRDVGELLLERGYAVTHETIRDWEFRFAPLLVNRLRANLRTWFRKPLGRGRRSSQKPARRGFPVVGRR